MNLHTTPRDRAALAGLSPLHLPSSSAAAEAALLDEMGRHSDLNGGDFGLGDSEVETPHQMDAARRLLSRRNADTSNERAAEKAAETREAYRKAWHLDPSTLFTPEEPTYEHQ